MCMQQCYIYPIDTCFGGRRLYPSDNTDWRSSARRPSDSRIGHVGGGHGCVARRPTQARQPASHRQRPGTCRPLRLMAAATCRPPAAWPCVALFVRSPTL
ncbi:hypothetical protein HAX54_040180 [Datura stramonium]|uniref:Uncharacterized protein n=1 Tax=Datura stramonium TaxID=4076 RepID=A0ABS8VNV0_DATST|nr:hypothetical protein [Datura stramonium]